MASGPSKAEAMRLTSGWNPPLLSRVFSMPATRRSYLFCLFGDELSARGAMRADRDVDRRGLVLAAARKLGVLGGRPHGFLDAIARLLLVLFAGGLVPTGQRDNRDRNTAG